MIITPNLRLARYLHTQHGIEQQSEPRKAWETPPILAFEHFIQQCWDQLSTVIPLPLILSANQALFYWRDIIQHDDDGSALINIPQSAQLALQAWETLQQWQVSLSELAESVQPDTQIFYRWAMLFNKRLVEQSQITSAQRLDILLEHIERLSLPATGLTCYNMDEITPAQQAFLNAVAQRVSVSMQDHKQPIAALSRQGFADRADEFSHMIAWAKQQLAEGKKHIACIIPELHTHRATLVRQFHYAFPEQTCVNISGGVPLLEVPIVNAAWACLQIRPTHIRLTELGTLLRSPYIGSAESEMEARALLDKQCREHTVDVIALSTLTAMANEQHCSELLQHLTQWCSSYHDGKRTFADWTRQLSNTLHALGWPGERQLNSVEYQAVQRVYDVFTELTNMDQCSEPVTRSTLLATLYQLLRNTLFQIQTPDAPIQVLGLLEATGMTFDAAWVAMMNDTLWPQAAAPNPLLPYSLQVSHNMPHANSEREFDFAQRITNRLRHSAQAVNFSYAEQEADHALSPSPLISDILEAHATPIAPLPSVAQTLFSSGKQESTNDHMGPAVTEDDVVRGGSAILKHQAHCPFRAFAYYRLQAETIGRAEQGVDPLTRGIITHDALEAFWRDCKTQAQLLLFTEAELTEKIHLHITKACKKTFSRLQSPISPAVLALEKKRLEACLQEWLAAEMTRPDFTVTAVEEDLSYQVGSLPLRMRIDRIDTDMYGNTLLIDYKTGITRTYDWFTERLLEPQLPVYAIANPRVTTITYGTVKRGQMKFSGISAEDCQIKGISTVEAYRYTSLRDWQALHNTWQEQLEQLAGEFYSGFAAVSPDSNNSCQRCELHGLCRIHEQTEDIKA